MFKTKEQIEELAKEFSELSAEHGYHRTESYRGFKIGYTQAQKDLLESASEDKQEAWLNYRKGEGHSFGHKEALDYGWQSCTLTKMKELQEKDEEIKEMREALQIIYDNSRANYIDKQEKEKFRQVVEKYKLHKY